MSFYIIKSQAGENVTKNLIIVFVWRFHYKVVTWVIISLKEGWGRIEDELKQALLEAGNR